MYLFLLRGDPGEPGLAVYEVGKPDRALELADVLDDLLRQVADRNPDFYEFENGRLVRAR